MLPKYLRDTAVSSGLSICYYSLQLFGYPATSVNWNSV